MNRLTELSGQLLLLVKKNESTKLLQEELVKISSSHLVEQLNGDYAKKTFWINIYNAFYQILAHNHSESKGNIYHRKEINIADYTFSLDDVEHGILRKYRWKWSKGYIANPFAKAIIKTLAVNKIDYRIHFALNCGAVSCPPIAFYTMDNIDQQLEMATGSFLESETTIFPEEKRVETSSLLNWFAADFGGKKGALAIISTVMEQDVSNYKLAFTKYNWDKQLANFS